MEENKKGQISSEEKKEMVVRKNGDLTVPRTGLAVKGELTVKGELAVKGELVAIQELANRGELTVKGEVAKNGNEEQIIIVESIKDAVDYLQDTKGNILTTTGALEIYEYTKLRDYQTRLYSRVVSNSGIVHACEELGIKGRHLISMNGPFTRLMNYAMLKDFHIRYLVTKDSGISSGFIEKMEAALELGVTMVVVAEGYREEAGREEEVIKCIKGQI